MSVSTPVAKATPSIVMYKFVGSMKMIRRLGLENKMAMTSMFNMTGKTRLPSAM